MTLLDPLSQLPEFETPRDACEMQARWPGLVVAARCSSSISEHRGFFEFAPLPGGSFLAGVGHERAGSCNPWSIRERILGQMLAGCDLGESLRNARSESDPSEVGYALFEPAGATLELCGFGPSVSAVHVTAGSARLVHVGLEIGCDTSRPFNLGPREAVVLVAHPRIWCRHLLGAVDHLLSRDFDGFSDSDAFSLCGRLEALLAARGISSVVVYRSAPTAGHPLEYPQGHEGPPATFESSNVELTLSDLELHGELIECFACPQ
jgi:hypothetical protein